MSFNTNRFNIYGNDFINHLDLVPIEMNHNSRLVGSMFMTSDRMNHQNLFASPPSFSSYQYSHVSSSSFQFNNSHMNYHMMRRNFDSVLGAEYFPIINNPHFTQVPINTLHIESVNRAMESNPNVWIPVSHPPNFLVDESKILNPTPLNVIYSRQDSTDFHRFDIYPFSSKRKHVSQENCSLKKILKPKTTYYVDSEECEKNDDDQ